MDFLIDDNMLKTLKPFGLAALGLAALATLALFINRNSEQNQSKQEQQVLSEKRKPAGIFNEGNTCFVNSLLQALAPLRSFISSLERALQQKKQKMNAHEELLFELKSALQKINQEKGTVDVVKFLEVVGSFSNIINLEQQDAYELFSIIVTSLEQVCQQQKYISLNHSSLSMGSIDDLEQEFVNCSQANENQATNALQGYIKSSIICSGCKEEQNIKIQPFCDLSLDITLQKIRTVEEAISHFQQKQYIEGYACTNCSVLSYLKQLEKVMKDLKIVKPSNWQKMNLISQQISLFLKNLIKQQSDLGQLNLRLGQFVYKFQKQYIEFGPNCKYREKIFLQISPILTTIVKQSAISKFPKILVLHLKQLSINPNTGEPFLLKKLINFPKKLTIPVRNGEKNYELISLVSHTGNESQGHYFTFRRLNKESENWFLISDTYSAECKEQFIKMHIPYMLFYELIQ